MAPGIALEILQNLKRPIRVLDPMMGSGTVVAMARSQGHRAIGIDIDPLAVLISRVWTTAIDAVQATTTAQRLLIRAKNRFKHLPSGKAYPFAADEETRKFIRYWFDDYTRRQLAALATEIGRVRNEAIRDVLWCGFSRLIITKQAGVSLAMDLAHSRPHKTYQRAPVKPFDRFVASVQKVVTSCLAKIDKKRGPAATVSTGDARTLHVRSRSIDLVLTSPPYLNAIDYLRCSKFSLVWMGYRIASLKKIRRDSVGAEVGIRKADKSIDRAISILDLRPRLKPREYAMLANYVQDMERSIREVARVLVPGGKAVYVVGENMVRGTFVRNAKLIEYLADKNGLRLMERRVRSLPGNRRYLPPPTKNAMPIDKRMRREAVLAFSKRRTSKRASPRRTRSSRSRN